MHILIIKDSATKIPREVKDLDEARGFEAMGFTVHLIGEDGMAGPLPPSVQEVFDAAVAEPKADSGEGSAPV